MLKQIQTNDAALSVRDYTGVSDTSIRYKKSSNSASIAALFQKRTECKYRSCNVVTDGSLVQPADGLNLDATATFRSCCGKIPGRLPAAPEVSSS